jgi:hypothetical protein
MRAIILTEKQWKDAPNLLAKRITRHLWGWFLNVVDSEGDEYPEAELLQRFRDICGITLQELIGEVQVISAFNEGSRPDYVADASLNELVGKVEITEKKGE